MPSFQEPIRGKSDRLGRLLFAEFVTQALRRRDDCFLPLQKLKVLFLYRNYGHVRAYVDGWVRMVVNNRSVVKLDLDFSHCGVSDLQLYNDDGEEVGDEIIHPYEFHISSIGPADEVKQLMPSCVNLESFFLEYEELYAAADGMNIVSESLKHLTLRLTDSCRMNYVVEICTPRLESIEN